jgi:hypothetical protein
MLALLTWGCRVTHMPVDSSDVGVITTPLVIGTPVFSSRQWTTGLAPRIRGGWKFIAQSWNYDDDVPTEWVLVNLDEGNYTVQQAKNRVYANSNFQVPSTNTTIVDNNQLRAPNGRIFFLERGNPGIGNDDKLNVAYYDPADEAIHQLPVIVDGSGGRHDSVYQGVFDQTGKTLYCGTQTAIGYTPIVFAIDTATLAVTNLGSVGVASSPQPKYAYYIAKDATPGSNWLYVAVGQYNWELVAINLSTNAKTVLLTTAGPGFQFIEFEQRAGLGWSANIINNGVQTRYWMADGAITAYPGSGGPPGGNRTITPYSNPLTSPPEIDWSRGIGFVSWRRGAGATWQEVDYSVQYRGSIQVESLLSSPNGGLVGNSQQYNGFFSLKRAAFESYGQFGISQPTLLAYDANTVYAAGYANGLLVRWNTQADWDAVTNPVTLGNFGANIRYPYFLRDGKNGRLYTAGRRERDSLGSGVGYYDTTTHAFVTNTTNLDDYTPRGFLVLPAGILVFSGELVSGAVATEAKLVLYSLDAAEYARRTVIPGMANSGELFPTSDPNIVFGIVNDAPYYIYRFNVATGQLLQSATIAGPVDATARHPSGTVWVASGYNLLRINPDTLAVSTKASIQPLYPVTLMAWRADTLYMVSSYTKVYSVQLINGLLGHLNPVPP